MKHIIGLSQNGLQVYADLTGPKVGKRLSRQPQLLILAREMLATANLHGPEIRIEYDMRRQIGYDFIVATTDTNAVFYARLANDALYTRFVKKGDPTPTSHLSAIIVQDAQNDYELCDIWIGHFTPPRPGSTHETIESKSYWSNHAFLLSDQPLQPQTLTKTCPY